MENSQDFVLEIKNIVARYCECNSPTGPLSMEKQDVFFMDSEELDTKNDRRACHITNVI